jgi:hypothetical protein
VVAGIGVTIALSLDLNHGVRVVGPLPQALPALVLPTLSLTSLEQLALPAGALALIGFISSVSVAQTLAQREQEQINPNREMLGLGASNVVAALAVLFIGGFLRSLQFTALNAMAYSDIDNAQASHATSLYTVVQQLSLSMGVVLAAFVLEGAQWWRADETLTGADFTIAFCVVAAVSAMSVLQFIALSPRAGEAVSGMKSD